MTPFPPVIDNSMRATFTECPHAFFRRYLQDLRRPGQSVHLHFGGAFAAAMHALRQSFYAPATRAGGDTQAALGAAFTAAAHFWGDAEFTHENKTYDRLIGAIEAYVAQYPLGTDHVKPLIGDDGSPSTEFNFALPLPINHPVSGEPILYSGRFDMLARMGAGLYIEDDKTTGQLGQSWLSQWRMRAQFSGYVWGARQYGYHVEGAIVRGISILKKSYGHAEVIEMRPNWMIDRWYRQLLRDIHRMIGHWREACALEVVGDDPALAWDQSLDSACSSYGGCAFLDLCSVKEPDKWLDQYEVWHFDPLATEE